MVERTGKGTYCDSPVLWCLWPSQVTLPIRTVCNRSKCGNIAYHDNRDARRTMIIQLYVWSSLSDRYYIIKRETIVGTVGIVQDIDVLYERSV